MRPDPYLVSHTLTGLVGAGSRGSALEEGNNCARRPEHRGCCRELRSLRVLVFHPDDQDGQELIGQLQRIGCQVKAFWPPLDKLPEEADLVFFAMRPEVLAMDLPWLRREGLAAGDSGGELRESGDRRSGVATECLWRHSVAGEIVRAC